MEARQENGALWWYLLALTRADFMIAAPASLKVRVTHSPARVPGLAVRMMWGQDIQDHLSKLSLMRMRKTNSAERVQVRPSPMKVDGFRAPSDGVEAVLRLHLPPSHLF